MYMTRTQKEVPVFQINTQKWVLALFFIIGFFLNPSIAEPKPNQGGGQESGNKDYHDFRYDPVKQIYHVNGKIPVSAVQKDLNGALCSKCHSEELAEVKNSVHFKIQAPNPRIMFPGGGAHGMLDRACGLPGTTGLTNYTSDVNLGECAKCHTGRFLPVMEDAFASTFNQMELPNPEQQAADIVNAGIDCLICHSESYTAVPEGSEPASYADVGDKSPLPAGFARAARDNTDFDRDGSPDLLLDTDGDGKPDMPLLFDSDGDGVPETPWQTSAQDRSPAAVMSVGPTTEETCMRCHEHNRTGYKRATFFAPGYDVHATLDEGPFDGATNRCTVCHRLPDVDGDGDPDHKFVRGHDVGGDMAAADFIPPPPGVAADPDDPTHLTCVQCHDNLQENRHNVKNRGNTKNQGKASTSRRPNKAHSDKHLSAIACQTCHITASSGITYSMYGHGAHLSFGRNKEGKDTKLITADHMIAENADDIAADFSAYRIPPTLVWFNGSTSFLAQSLAVRGSPNAKIFPFKPMANGMVFDARFFSGEKISSSEGVLYNAHSMFRFFANEDANCSSPVCSNAEVLSALNMLDLTPEETRGITLADFISDDPKRQAMAMMQIFPNLVYFDKQSYGYEHYLTSSDSIFDKNNDGYIDVEENFFFDMFRAANAGLTKFQGFNFPMRLPVDYQWYPPFKKPQELVTMKLPDGTLMKMFLSMQADKLPESQREAYLASIENYPAFSNGITLGGHGVRKKEEALGASPKGCLTCHGEDGVLAAPVPVTRKEVLEIPNMGSVELPLYQWKYYNVHKLVDLGLQTTGEAISSGQTNVDIADNENYVRTSSKTIRINWFMPESSGYMAADDSAALEGTDLTTTDVTWNKGSWMPVLEPVVDYVPNYEVLGYKREEVIRKPAPGSNRPPPPNF